MKITENEWAVETVEEVCGLYFRSVLLLKAGVKIPQHIHTHSHANYCGAGSAEYWEDGTLLRTVKAGDAIEVKAGKYHEFIALEDNTRLTCVHDVASANAIKEKGL